jgi:glycosyltransferase involved in cell wall biosynthesis
MVFAHLSQRARTDMKFSLVIPCYNEAANLPLLLERCRKVAAQPDVEVILVDNGSSDNSSQLLTELLPQYPGCRSVRVEVNQGYGFGILSGLHAASGEFLGWTHADMQTDPQDALVALDLIEKHGSKTFVKGRRYGRPLADIIFTMGMSAFETLLLGVPLWDINAQPTVFPRRFFETWTHPPHDFSLDLYAYFMARRAGLAVHRFPVRFGERAHGVSHWNVNWAAKRKFIRRTIDFSLQLKKSLKP